MAKKYNICLDIGGTKILGVIFDQEKNIVYRIKKKTKKDGDSTDNVEKVIISVVEEMLEGSGISKKEVAAIAAGAPGVIDQAKGIILFSPNLPWRNYDIKSSMEKKFGVPFYIGNHGRRPDPERRALQRSYVQGRRVRTHDPGSRGTALRMRTEGMP